MNSSKDLQLWFTSPVSPGYVATRREAGTKKDRKCHAEKDAEIFFLGWKAFFSPGREALFEQFPYKGNSTFSYFLPSLYFLLPSLFVSLFPQKDGNSL